MSEDGGSKTPRFWQPAWWSAELRKADRQDSCRRVAESSAPTPSYYVLIVLSTLIASYGLVSNSTATVIGAMIVAPLMGPILGLALGTVLADTRMFRRSLIAEVTGAVLVVATGFLVAQLVGPQHIDFSSSEIANRTSPTLYDFAIGLAAGLAGAYCTVHPGLQGSIAGVAIAVALVPPLSVTGLCAAGWFSGHTPFSYVFGSFMLFFTNLVTIELASALVFYGTGFRQAGEQHSEAAWRKVLAIKGVLIVLTGLFLTGQLRNLLRERFGLSTSHRRLVEMLKDIPGAQLDSLQAKLQERSLTVTAVVGSRTEIKPATVAGFEKRLAEAIHERLPNVTVRLVVRTVNSTYASSSGYLFEPTRSEMTDEQRREQLLGNALTDLLSTYPGVELANFHTSADSAQPGNTNLTVTLSTPYVFTPRLVKALQDQLGSRLAGEPLFADRSFNLLVRSAVIHSATSVDSVALEAPAVGTASEYDELAREEKLRELLISSLELNGDISVLEVHIRRAEVVPPEPGDAPDPTPTPVVTEDVEPRIDAFEAQLVLRSPNLLSRELLSSVQKRAETVYHTETGFQLQLSLDAQMLVGSEAYLQFGEKLPPTGEKPVADAAGLETLRNRLTGDLGKLLANTPGAVLEGQLGLQQSDISGNYRVFAVVTSPKPLENKTVLEWQKALLESRPELRSLELSIENRLGRTIKLTPARRRGASTATPTPPP